MNGDNLNIEEIREKCNAAIDYLIEKLKSLQIILKEEIKKCEEKLNQNLKEYEDSIMINKNFFSKLLNVVKLGLNIFSMTVLNIDREFLDFDFYKGSTMSKSQKLHMPKDSFEVRCVPFLDGAILTLNEVRNDINVNDTDLMLFYRGLVDIAYNNQSLWDKIFETMEKLNINIKYSLEERKFLFPRGCNSSEGRELESELRDVLESSRKNTIRR